jgi:hypothetical protein
MTFTRFTAITAAALAFAPVVASAQEGEAVDVAALQGKIESLAEQYAETKTAVDGLQKLKFSGYIQGRYAYRVDALYYKGSGDGSTNNDNFYVRRGRLKAVYNNDLTAFTLQVDAIPSGLSLKEGFGTVKLPMGWAIDAGLQLMPFGYEVGSMSSADLDLLERGQASDYYAAGQYDVGVSARGKLGPANLRFGVFNGNGVSGGFGGVVGKDNDPRKDFIGRATFDFGILTAGVSGWWGKNRDMQTGIERVRSRVGVDAQLYLDLLPIGGTFVKGEFMYGLTGIASPAANPGRAGHGYYAIVGQNLGLKFLVAARWDSFTKLNGLDISDLNATTKANVLTTNEVSAAGHFFVGEGRKVSLAWYHAMNGDKGSLAPAQVSPHKDRIEAQVQAKF